MVRVSAIVCTHRRPGLLAAALRSLAAQTLDRAAFEVLVVANGAADRATRDVAAAAELPNLRLLREPALGLSRTRNTGWRAARGEYVAYLDDDAAAAPDWLERILAAFEDPSRPQALGGRVVPDWGAPPPPWLATSLYTYLSVLDRSPAARLLEPHEHIVGANMAFPRRVLEQVGGFPAWLGRRGGRLLSGEEVLVVRRVHEAGGPVRYDPAVVVRHHVPAERLTRSWMVRRAFWQGVSEALLLRHEAAPSRAERLRVAWRQIRHVASSPRQVASLLFPDPTAEGFRIRVHSCSRMGYVRGLLAPVRW